VELVATFLLVWLLIAAALNFAAERFLSPELRSRRLWRNLTGLLILSVSFLAVWVPYRVFLGPYLTAEYDRMFEGRRSAAQDCGARYSHARTRRDSVTVDTMHPVSDVTDPHAFLTCRLLRESGELECGPGSQC
jgi:hypothetical protein